MPVSNPVRPMHAFYVLAGLTNKDYWRMTQVTHYFKDGFSEAAAKTSSIRFDVTGFDPSRAVRGVTNWEFDEILSNPALLQNTTFFLEGVGEVRWTENQFVPR